MKRPIASHFYPVAFALGAVAVASAAAWLLRRSGPAPELVDRPIAAVPVLSGEISEEDWQDLPPSSLSFEEARDSQPVDARPARQNVGLQSPDDYDALSPEELGAAFLAGATALEEPPSATSEIAGFRIFHGAALADESDDNDDRVDVPDERG
jgi:hypothetical protein